MAHDTVLSALKASVACLEELGVRYALVGGAAMPAWGRARATADADILIYLDPSIHSEAQAIVGLVKSFRDHGFAHLEKADRRKLADKTILHFWFPLRPQGISVRVDLLLGRAPEYKEMVGQAVARKLNDFSAQVASCEDLILLKLAAGRAIDLADIEDLIQINKPTLDKAYLDLRAVRMKLSRELEEAWAKAP